MFGPTMQELLNIEKKFIENSINSKLKVSNKLGCAFAIVGKPWCV